MKYVEKSSPNAEIRIGACLLLEIETRNKGKMAFCTSTDLYGYFGLYRHHITLYIMLLKFEIGMVITLYFYSSKHINVMLNTFALHYTFHFII